MPRLQEVDGCVGLSLLADQRTGRCIVTTAWETEEAMRASAEQIQPVRDQAAQAFGGTGSPMVEEWEIAVLHRDHRSGEGACARATWVKLPPDQLDQGIEFYKTSVLPELEALDGFCSASLLVDRASGRAVASTSFDSLEAMNRNREQATALKNDEDCRSRAPTSSTTASSSSGSPICGHPSWSDRWGRPADPTTGCRPVLLVPMPNKRSGIAHCHRQSARGRWLVEPVAPPGRCPRAKRVVSCTRALPLSRRNRRPSTPGSRTFAM